MIRVVPTLTAMAAVYRLPTTGGMTSARFKAYVALGAAGVPVSGYNPMTNKPALATVEALLAASAEPVAEVLANRTMDRLGVTSEQAMHWCVKTPGMWTDRVATEIEHRMVRGPAHEILFWTGEHADRVTLERAVVAQSTRMAWDEHRGQPGTVGDFVAREGLAMAMTGATGHLVPEVADMLAVVADEEGPGIATALLYGDEAARGLGWSPLGIGAMDGYAHATAIASEALVTTSVDLTRGDTWTRL